jgi:transcriptional regulator with XRE-family HTH domain
MKPAPTTRSEEIACLKAAFGRRLTALREMAWPDNRKVLAAEFGVTEHGIGRWERGEIIPAAYDLVRLAQIFRVDINFLVTGDTAGLPERRARELREAGVI